jgi:hypothetical protein
MASSVCQRDNSIRIQNKYGYQIVQIEEYYALADSLGNVLIDKEFDEISLEPLQSYEKGRNTFVGKKGNKAYLISPHLNSIAEFDSIKILEGGQYICINKNSYSLVDDDFIYLHEDLDYLSPLYRFYYEFIFKKNGMFGILDEEEILIQMKVDSLIDIYSRRYVGVVNAGKMGLFDFPEKTIILEPKYDYIFESHFHKEHEEKRFLIYDNNLFNLINAEGEVLTEGGFESVTTWVEYGPKGHYICIGNKIGIIDYDGEVVIPVEYEELFYCTSGVYKAVRNGKFGVIGIDKRVLIPFIYESIIVDDFRVGDSEEPFIYAMNKGLWIKINYSGVIVDKDANDSVFIKELAPFQVDHYGFEYVRSLMITSEKMPSL